MELSQEEQEKKKAKQYEEYVKKKTPVHNLAKNMAAAFISGGLICTLGQAIMNFCQWQGAGTLVPITGFANSVAAPAIEYQKEGQVFGIGCKIFTIAGPVILYGILVSSFLGLIYYFLHMWGIV